MAGAQPLLLHRRAAGARFIASSSWPCSQGRARRTRPARHLAPGVIRPLGARPASSQAFSAVAAGAALSRDGIYSLRQDPRGLHTECPGPSDGQRA
jgi:hypothetical protein